MKVLRLFPLVLVMAACSSVNVPLSPYRIDVQQGNALEQESVEKLKPGLTRSQVRFLLGTPLMVDPFHTNRWDYVYNYRKGGKLTEERRLVLFFEGNVLARIEAEGFPARGDVPEARPTVAAKPPEKPAEPANAVVAQPAPALAQAPETAKPAQPAPVSAAVAEKPAAPAPQPQAEPPPATVQPAAPAQAAPPAERGLEETSIVPPLDSAQAKAARQPAAVSDTPPDAVALQSADNAAALKPLVMPEFPDAASTSGSPEEQIAAALNAWASAWRARDEEAYLSAYAENFRPEGGQSRAEWEKRRRLLLGVSRNIDIKIEGVATEILSENRAVVSFKQIYRSDTYQDAVIKQMKLVRVDNLWLIEEEKVLAPARVKK